ncbi:MAG: integrase family protein [Rhodobacteraceae bacterium]|nr:integrase family protein [Paracoccaceae bacterium]
MPKLTETYAKKIPHSSEGTQKYWDTEIKGLVLFVGKQSKTWYFQKDVGGKTKRVLIGRFPVISSQAARQTAMGLALEMGRGAGKMAQIGAPRLETAMEVYLARPKLRSEQYRHGVQTYMENQLKDWLRMPLDEISKAMVVRRHQELASSPSTANHALRYFRSIYNHARRTYNLPECPTMAVEWYEEKPDGRIIEDLREWRQAVAGLQNPIHKVFYELLLFTGLRKAEALTLQWNSILEDRIHLPMTKNGRSFDLPILQTHHEILAPLRPLSRKWVFPSPKSVTGHITGPEKLKWSPHAHRRTFATVAMEAGVLEEIVGRLLNHTPLSITGQRYTKPSLDALRPSVDVVCTELEKRLSFSKTE